MGAGAEKGQTGFGYCHKMLIQVGVNFEQISNQIFIVKKTDRLQ